MNALWWFLLGVAVGAGLMVPSVRFLLRRAEKRARVAERRARDSERLAELGAMTGGLAHEIKNPLSTVGLNAQLLAEGLRESDLPQEPRDRLLRRLDALRREVERLRDILSDFLQFAGRMKLDPQPVDLCRTVDELCDFFLPQCDQAKVILRCRLPDEPLVVRLDASLFKQALLNLMINAVQAMSRNPGPSEDPHARAGELILRVERSDTEAAVHVTDTGPGIARENVEEVFRPYVSGRAGGTGLGLPIARRIVEEHGGRLTVTTEPDRGSDFTIHLPLQEEPAKTGR